MTIHESFLIASLAALLAPTLLGCGDGDVPQAIDHGDGDTGGGATASTTGPTGTTGPSGTGGGTGSGGGDGGTGGGAPPPPPPGIAFLDLTMPVDLTPDGSIALLVDGASPVVDAYFYDTVTAKLELKTQIGDPLADMATGISAKGQISAMHGVPVQAGLWSEAGGWIDLGTPYPAGCDINIAGGFDVSADGKVAVGLLWHGCGAEAFRWTDTGGAGKLTPLELLGSSFEGSTSPPTNRATVVSDDGSVAAGFAQHGAIDRSPAMWNADGSGVLLDPTELDWPGEVLSISSDGKVIAGTRGYDGFVWTKEDGMVSLGKPASAPDQLITFPNAVAADGKLVFGAFGDPWQTLPIAFVWTATGGMRALADILAESGIELPAGSVLSNVLAASSDGSVLLGSGYDPDSNAVSFVLRLPISAYGL